MDRESIQEAVESGHKASSALKEVLSDLADNQWCHEADGFEGRDTFPECGECAVCIAKDLRSEDVV